jgi:hypothetical protein
MSGENDLDSSSFKKNYKIFKEVAEWHSNDKVPDIDQFVPQVERAMNAYTICKDRLDKVKATLGQYFEKEDVKRGSLAEGDGQVDEDEDISF